MSHNKILIISGPTATGKTALASYFAKKYNGELVSTDSCQIYKGMDIGTGKDQPGDIPIHLIDIITPDIKFSVSQFKKVALDTINEIHSRGKLPILVGCSGLYTKSIISNHYSTFDIKPNLILRFFLNKFSTSTLQKIYLFLDKNSYLKLNKSDVNNPHRLIRKIELKLSLKNRAALSREVDSTKSKTEGLNGGFNTLHLSLTAPLDILYKRIDDRVQSRIDEGFLSEVESLLKKYKWSDPGMQIGAYLCMKPYFDFISKASLSREVSPIKLETEGLIQNKDSLILSNCLQKWRYAEHSDARRQGTFFKTQFKSAIYINTSDSDFKQKADRLVSKWYN